MRRRIIPLVQLALGLGIIGFIMVGLYRKGELSSMGSAFRQAAGAWPLLAVACAFFGCAILLCIRRWGLILRSQGHELTDGTVAVLSLVGQFFNAFLLGATGGDLVKAYYAACETHHRRTEIVTTVFIDRTVGLIALVFLTIAVMLSRLRFFLSFPATRTALIVYGAALVVVLAALLLVFRRDMFNRWPFLARMEAETKLGDKIARSYRSFRSYLNRPGIMARALALSVCNHVFSLTAAFYVGMALGLDLGFWDYAACFLVINAISTIPITPSGLGTRETACILLLVPLGVPVNRAVSLSLMLYTAYIFWSLVGGVVYLFYSARRGRLKDILKGET